MAGEGLSIAELLDFPEQLDFDTEGLATPCYLIEEARLRANLERLGDVVRRSGCRILLGQKGFSMFRVYPLLAQTLQGTTASSLHELQLAADYFEGERQIYAPAFREADFAQISGLADVVIFNSAAQLELGLARGRAWSAAQAEAETATEERAARPWAAEAQALGLPWLPGIRLNPEHSTQDGGLYDPCAPHSRLGITRRRWDETMRPELSAQLTGFHMHTLCEQNSDDLVATVEALEARFGDVLAAARDEGRLAWLNLGGGHHITRPDYDVDALVELLRAVAARYRCPVYIEPGEAIALNTGWLITRVLAVEENEMPLAILDSSAECHMPDVLAMPYRPHILGAARPGEKAYTYRLGSATCLAGDVIGDYSFDRPLAVGDQLVLGDMAHYTMVKNNTFNGIGLPDIVLRRLDGQMELVRRFGYDDYRSRLS